MAEKVAEPLAQHIQALRADPTLDLTTVWADADTTRLDIAYCLKVRAPLTSEQKEDYLEVPLTSALRMMRAMYLAVNEEELTNYMVKVAKVQSFGPTQQVKQVRSRFALLKEKISEVRFHTMFDVAIKALLQVLDSHVQYTIMVHEVLAKWQASA